MTFLKYNRIIIALFLIGFIIFTFLIANLQVDYDLKSYRPDNDPGYELIKSHYEDFKIAENYMIIGISNNNGIFRYNFLNKVKTLTRSIDTMRNVSSSQSIATMNRMVYTASGLMRFPFIHFDDSTRLKEDSIRIMNYPLLKNWYISRHGDALTIYIQMAKHLSKDAKISLINKIESIVANNRFSEIHFGGNTYTDIAYSRLLSREMIRMVTLTILILLILGLLMYRSVRVLGILFFVVVGGLAYLYGYLSIVRTNISMINMVFPTLILIVGMSDFIHFYSGFTDQLRKNIPRDNAIKNTLKTIGRDRKSVV